MELYSVLVTGANRGIGLEFVRQLVRLPKPPRYLFATYRSSESLGPLTDIKNSAKDSEVVLIKMDVTKHEDAIAARKIIQERVKDNGLTLLINNAGVFRPVPFPQITEENLLFHFKNNTVAPVMVFQEMLSLLQKAAAHNASVGGLRVSRAAVLNMTSCTGSISRTGVEFVCDLVGLAYKMSKAALNMAIRGIATSVKDQGILAVCICPGWVKTDMGTEHAEISLEDSIRAILKILPKLDETHQGSFIDRFGNPYPF